MDAKTEAKEIYDEIDNIHFTTRVKLENESGETDIDIPDWVIKKIGTQLIDRMTHIKGSITEQYWRDVREALNAL